jgi:cytoplasmic tRNA 2-thiolation protein 1
LREVLRGDLPRLSRGTSIITSSTSGPKTMYSDIKRSKPLKFAYEKEIVLYAHHRKLDYFSTECIYSPEAFRGTARALIKDLERIRPSAILDIVRSGEDMAKLCPGQEQAGKCAGACSSENKVEDPEDVNGCGSSAGDEMRKADEFLAKKEHRLAEDDDAVSIISTATVTSNRGRGRRPHIPAKQTLGVCEKCGYMSSQKICKACVLLEGLNRDRPKWRVETEIDVNALEKTGAVAITNGVGKLNVASV